MNDFDEDQPDDFIVSPVPQPPPLPPLSAPEKGDSLFWIFAMLFGFVGALIVLLAVLIGGVYLLLNHTQSKQQQTTQQPRLNRDLEQVSTGGETRDLNDDEVVRVDSAKPYVLPPIDKESQTFTERVASSPRETLEKVSVSPLTGLPKALLKSSVGTPANAALLDYDLSVDNSFYTFFSFESLSGKTLSGKCKYSPTEENPLDAVAEAEDFEPRELAQGGGTGFIVHPDGIVVTCAHVVENIPAITVTIGEKKLPARLLAINHDKDLAVLKVNVSRIPYLALDDHRQPLGEPARVFGFPLTEHLGRSLKMSTGSVSGFDETEKGTRIQMDAVANPGNSGGPVTNNQGTVIGIVDSILTGNDVANMSFAVPVKDLLFELEKLNVSFQKIHAAVPVGDPLLANRLQDVSHAVVRVGHSEELPDRWVVVKYDLTIGKERQQGKLLVDRSGNTINLGEGMFASQAMQDLTTIGFLPLPSTGNRTLELEDAALLTRTIVEQTGRATGNAAMDLHQQLLERMRNRMTPGFGGMGVDPFRRNRATTATKTREVIQLVRWTDKLELQDVSPELQQHEILWNRETSARALESDENQQRQNFQGSFVFDTINSRLHSGHLKRSSGKSQNTTLSFSIKSEAEVREQQAVAENRRREAAEAAAEERELLAQKNRERDQRLDKLQSPTNGLTKYRPND